MKKLAEDKHSSLFNPNVDNEEKGFTKFSSDVIEIWETSFRLNGNIKMKQFFVEKAQYCKEFTQFVTIILRKKCLLISVNCKLLTKFIITASMILKTIVRMILKMIVRAIFSIIVRMMV